MIKNIQIKRDTGQALPVQLAEQIKLLIKTGQLKSSEKLPPGTKLAEMTGLAYTTVDTALQNLAAEGVVERSRRGTFVRPEYVNSCGAVSAIRLAVLFATEEERDNLFKRKELEGINDILCDARIQYDILVIEELKKKQPEWLNALAESSKYSGFIVDKEMAMDREILNFDYLCKKPIIYFNSLLEPLLQKRAFVRPDNFGGMFQIIEHLKKTGLKNMALLRRHKAGGPDNMKQSAFDSSQINFTPKENQTDSKPSNPKTMTNKAPDSNIFTCGENKKNIEYVLAEILSSGQKFEAFVCATDIIAFHTINYLKSRSIRVPDDIAVTGFNNYDIAEICDPPITTVSVDMREIGRTIARMMLDEIAGIDHRNVTLRPFQLIVRGSA